MATGTIIKENPFFNVVQTQSTDDLNNYTTPGIYYLTANGSSPITNAPPGARYRTLVIFPLGAINANMTVVQFIIGDSCFVRQRSGSPPSWTGWKQFTLTSV